MCKLNTCIYFKKKYDQDDFDNLNYDVLYQSNPIKSPENQYMTL